MITERDFMVQQERYKDLLREAEMERLIRQISPGPMDRIRAYGGALVGWVRRLGHSRSATTVPRVQDLESSPAS